MCICSLMLDRIKAASPLLRAGLILWIAFEILTAIGIAVAALGL